MKKEPDLFRKSDPYTSAHYFQDNLKLFEALSEPLEIGRREAPHFHDEIEMLYLAEGSATLTVNGVDFLFEPGGMAWLFPFHVHSLRPAGKGKIKGYLCRYSLSVLIYLKINRQYTPMSLSILEYAPPCLPMGAEQEQVKGLFEDILRENEEKQPDYELILLSCLLRLVAIFERKASVYIETQHYAARSMVWNAFQYLQFHFNQEIDSASVAAKFGISASQLNGALRLLTGKNFFQNLHDARIRNACAMMQFDELSIPYIARAVGYRSPAAFYRQFKAIKGKTPDQYRSGALEEPSRGQPHVSDSAYALLSYINENYRDPITAETAAAALFVSEATVNNTVEKNFHSTFSQVLILVRLWVAAGLLLGTQMPVCDIALAVGFNAVRTFSRCFTQEFGTSPTAFRSSGRLESRGDQLLSASSPNNK